MTAAATLPHIALLEGDCNKSEVKKKGIEEARGGLYTEFPQFANNLLHSLKCTPNLGFIV